MYTITSTNLDSYQAGARAVRSKSFSSVALGAAAAAALPATAAAQILTPTGPGLSNTAGSSPFNMRVTTLNMTTGVTGVNTGAYIGAPAGTWDIMFRSYSTGNSGENHYMQVIGLDAGFGTAKVSVTPNNGLTSNVLTKLSFETEIGSSTNFGTNSVEYFTTPNLGSPNLKTPEWSNTTGYFGVQFFRADGVHYGWVKLVTSNNGATLTINSLYSNPIPGASIDAGTIPEPASSAALLGMGAAALAAYRRRRDIRRAA